MQDYKECGKSTQTGWICFIGIKYKTKNFKINTISLLIFTLPSVLKEETDKNECKARIQLCYQTLRPLLKVVLAFKSASI